MVAIGNGVDDCLLRTPEFIEAKNGVQNVSRFSGQMFSRFVILKIG